MSNLACADSLMAIFGYRRVLENATDHTAEYECLLNGGALHDPTHPASGRLISSKPVDATPGELSLEDRMSE